MNHCYRYPILEMAQPPGDELTLTLSVLAQTIQHLTTFPRITPTSLPPPSHHRMSKPNNPFNLKPMADLDPSNLTCASQWTMNQSLKRDRCPSACCEAVPMASGTVDAPITPCWPKKDPIKISIGMTLMTSRPRGPLEPRRKMVFG